MPRHAAGATGSFPLGTPGGSFPRETSARSPRRSPRSPSPRPGRGQERDALARFVPVVVHDSRDDLAAHVGARRSPAAVPGVPDGRPGPRSTAAGPGAGCSTGCSSPPSDQDRGVLRTGRHAGDWEMVQYAVRDGALVRGVYAQHRGAERCAGGAIRTRRAGRPLVFLARRLARGVLRARACATGCGPTRTTRPTARGVRVRPRLVRDHRRRAAVDALPRAAGAARDAGWVPGEMDSPRGPAFQPGDRWSDPAAWARAARSCTRADCDRIGECDQPRDRARRRRSPLGRGAAGARLRLAPLAPRDRARGASTTGRPSARAGLRPRPAGR